MRVHTWRFLYARVHRGELCLVHSINSAASTGETNISSSCQIWFGSFLIFPIIDSASAVVFFVKYSDSYCYVYFMLDPDRTYSLPFRAWRMIEGFVLLPSVIRPVLLFAACRMTEGGFGGIADRLARSNLSLLFTILRHHGQVCDGDAVLAIKRAIPNVGLENIRFSPALRSIFNGRLQNAHLIGQSVRCNCRGPSKL
jgi:hypothetical protein